MSGSILQTWGNTHDIQLSSVLIGILLLMEAVPCACSPGASERQVGALTAPDVSRPARHRRGIRALLNPETGLALVYICWLWTLV